MCARGLHFILIKNPFLVVYSITNFRIYRFLRSRFDGLLLSHLFVVCFGFAFVVSILEMYNVLHRDRKEYKK